MADEINVSIVDATPVAVSIVEATPVNVTFETGSTIPTEIDT